MKRQYISPKMDIVAIIRHRLLIGSGDEDLVKGKSNPDNTNEQTQVGW